MESFDKSGVVNKAAAERERVKATTFVKDSKSRQRVAWGSSTVSWGGQGNRIVGDERWRIVTSHGASQR